MKDELKTKKQLINELEELRQRVAELEASEIEQEREGELLRIFRASSPVGLYIIQGRKFKFVNDYFYQAVGVSRDALLGTDPMAIVLPEDRNMVRENAIKMLRGERLSPYKYRIITKYGQVRWMLEGLASIQYQGKRATLGHAMDITEPELAEAKLQELYAEEKKVRRELEAEVQRRIRFTRALVHELKTPLTPVLASSELLVAELHDEPWVSIAGNIHRGALNLSKRIDGLLDLAKVEIGILQLNTKMVDVQQLLRRVANDMTAMVSRNGQSMVLELPPSLPVILADEERLQQVLLNLLVNASKFTQEGGIITLKAEDNGTELIVEVHDTGPGIPEEQQARLFQPYYRYLSDREQLHGLGLGLVLSKLFVELHGGRIWVISKVGEGSTFGFALPIGATDQAEEGHEQEVNNESPNHRG
ncbi:MAG: PAS domain-containing sensor histidine kinase [Dehalococcoidales bacterium]|nr:MAG: PAS domain-containing sensor histidine kinase [Dehalococcoidales bacterium]